MKKQILTIVSLLWALSSMGQQADSTVYRSFFGGESTKWYIAAQDYHYYLENWTLWTEGDTMIAGVQYRKVYTDYYRQDYPIYIGAAREEVQTGKLWWRANRANYDYLLVDMSLNKGDFFCDYPVDTVYYDSAGRKIVTLGDDYDPDHQIHFIEGVGADRNQLIDNFTNSPCDNLICVFHDNIRVFQTTLFDSTWVDFNTCRVIRDNLSIHSLQRKKCLELYPNPFTDNTEIEYYVPANVTSAEIYIFSLSGLLLQTYPLSDFGHGYVTVSGSSLEAGMYVYALVVDGRIVDSKRMILTR